MGSKCFVTRAASSSRAERRDGGDLVEGARVFNEHHAQLGTEQVRADALAGLALVCFGEAAGAHVSQLPRLLRVWLAIFA